MTSCTTSSPYACAGCEEHVQAATELFYKHLIADDLTLPFFVDLDLDLHLEAVARHLEATLTMLGVQEDLAKESLRVDAGRRENVRDA